MIEETAPDGVYAIGQPAPHVRRLDVVPGAGPEPLHREADGLTLHQARALAYLAEQTRLHHPGQLPAPHLPDGGASCATSA